MWRDASEMISSARTTAYIVFVLFRNCSKESCDTNSFAASMFSRMSNSRRATRSSLKGIYLVAQNILLHDRLQRGAIHHVDTRLHQIGQVELDSHIVVNAQMSMRIEFDEHVDIAPVASFPSCQGAKDR